LVGDPDLTNPASVTPQEVAAWQAEGVVECLGHRPDVPSLYAQAHIVTLPSYYGEGLPKSLIEAAACGRAVVTTDMPGCRDAIESDVTGLLVPPRDAIALADALEHLIRDVKLRQTMGKAGRALAEREFGIEKVVDAHLRIYKDLLEPCAP
jgi:glycosyltransferase involved in cell wall biosynthesis